LIPADDALERAQHLADRVRGLGQLERRARALLDPVGEVQEGIADELAVPRRRIDQARAPARGARPVPRDEPVAAREPAGGEGGGGRGGGGGGGSCRGCGPWRRATSGTIPGARRSR